MGCEASSAFIRRVPFSAYLEDEKLVLASAKFREATAKVILTLFRACPAVKPDPEGHSAGNPVERIVSFAPTPRKETQAVRSHCWSRLRDRAGSRAARALQPCGWWCSSHDHAFGGLREGDNTPRPHCGVFRLRCGVLSA